MKTLYSFIEILEARIAPATIYGVDETAHLIHFDSATPGTVVTATVSGLGVGEHLEGIDFRPATGELYALGITDNGANDTGRIYKVNLTTAAATAVGAAFSTTLKGANDYAFDFNPVTDKIRVVGDTGGENLQIDPNTGQIFSTDTNVTAGTQIDGVAYSNNFEGATKTTLYGINKPTAHLVTIGGIDGNPPPSGGVVTPASSGLGFTPANFKIGFDIESRTGTGYVVMTVGATTGLYTVDLTTGIATSKGAIGGNPSLPGMSVAPPDDLTIVNATTATYVDQDGDNVTVKITGTAPGASLSKSDFRFSTGQFGSQLKSLDLSAASHGATPQEWAHANITINAVLNKTPLRGDSFAIVGYINATGVDLGAVVVNGDLGQIDAGDATTTNSPGLVSLTVQSMGVVLNSQLPNGGVPDQQSDIVGKLGSLTVKSDFTRELIAVTGGATDGAIGNITIGGDLVGIGLFAKSGITSTGPMGNILVKGDIFGGAATGVGSIIAGNSANIGTVTIYGSIYGGSTTNAGIIQADNIGNVVIKGSIYGGTGDHTGEVRALGILGNVTIAGSIVGGTLANANEVDSGIVFSTGSKVGNVTVGGSLEGSNGSFTGSIYSGGTLGNVTIGGSVKGGTAGDSGGIEAAGNMGAVKISGDLIGGTGDYAGSLKTFVAGSIASVTVLGNVTGSSNTINGIIAANQLGAVKILGSLESLSPGGVRISALGDPTVGKTAKSAAAIASISISGSARNALILGGYSVSGNAFNSDATIGAVTVGQNWIGTQLVAGVTNLGANHAPGGGDDNINFGNSDDTKITVNDAAALISKIASVTIKGYAIGTVGGTDNFGIVAEQVGLVKLGLRTYTLATGTDPVGLPLGVTGDFQVHEVA